MGALFPTARPGIDLRNLYFNAPAPPQSLQEPSRALSDRLNDAVTALGQRAGLSKRQARKVATLADLTAVGNLTSAFDAGSDIRKGDYVRGTLGGLLSMFPDGGGLLNHAIIGPVFHGGRAFEGAYDFAKAGSNAGNKAQKAMWFTPDPKEANRYAFLAGDASYSGTALYPSMIDDTGFLRITPEMNTFGHRDGMQFYHSSFFDPTIRRARRQGLPGVIFEKVKEGPDALDQIAVFDTSRVKAAWEK